MEIKPIKLVVGVERSEIPQSRLDKNLPRLPASLKPPSGNWQFAGGRIVLNGQDVGRLIEQSMDKPPAFWSKLANDLDRFRTFFIRKNSGKRKKRGVADDDDVDPTGELGHLSALVEAYIAKIMRILKRKYDETTDGLACTLDDDGQLTINGMNVTSFIEMARRYPGKKARLFLKGLKQRLSVILSNKMGSPNYEKIRDTTWLLIKDIDAELKRIVEKDRLLENT